MRPALRRQRAVRARVVVRRWPSSRRPTRSITDFTLTLRQLYTHARAEHAIRTPRYVMTTFGAVRLHARRQLRRRRPTATSTQDEHYWGAAGPIDTDRDACRRPTRPTAPWSRAPRPMALSAGCWRGARRTAASTRASVGQIQLIGSKVTIEDTGRRSSPPSRPGRACSRPACARATSRSPSALRQHRHPARGDRRRDRRGEPGGRRLGGLQHRTEHRRGHALRLHPPTAVPGRQERDDRRADADRRAPNAAPARHRCRRRDRGQRAVQRAGARAAQRRQRRRRRAAGGGLPGQGLPRQGQEAPRRLRAALESHRVLRQGRDRSAGRSRAPTASRSAAPTCGSSCARPASAPSTSIAAA